MRAAITIVYNGMNHFQHKGFTEFMVNNFDYWVIAEGHCRNGGSTEWCKLINVPANSKDGTVEFIHDLARKHKNVLTYSHHKYYKSKDEQFNKAIALLRTKTQKAWLWQVDVDEHWKAEDLESAEHNLWRSVLNVASFQFNHYVKHNVIATGEWGSGRVNRLWKWKGQMFESHEPAVMEGQTRKELELPYKFDHYSMVFKEDVRFKSKYYRGHEQIYSNWKSLDYLTYPVHISKLFGINNPIGRSDSFLHKIEEPCVNVTSLADLKSN